MVPKVVFFWMFVNTAVWFVHVKAHFGLLQDDDIKKDAFGDYVLATEQTLKYSMSDKNPKQMVLYNDATQTGLVIDGANERVAFERVDGSQLVMDLQTEKVFEGNRIPHLTESEFHDLLADYNTTTFLVEKPFNDTTETEPPEVVKSFCDRFRELLRTIRGSICKAIRIILSPILEVLRVFGSFLTLGIERVFKLLRCGFLGLLNIFKWLARLLGKIIGGINKIVDAGIKLVLQAIITAANGALALWEILKCFIKNFDLMKILKFVLKIPKMLCYFITGLGGKIMQGVTGVFEIICKIFTFTISNLFRLIKAFIRMILCFFRGKRPSRVNMDQAVDNLLEVAKQQKDQYHNPDDYKNYEEFLLATKGKGSFNVQGVPLGKIVTVIMDTGSSAKGAVLKIFEALDPLASMKHTIPVLMVTMIESLHTTEGLEYVKQVFPEIKIEDDALAGATRSLASELKVPEELDNSHLLDLPSADKLKSMPIVQDIYKELEIAALKFTNSSLESLLDKKHLEQLVASDTKVDG